MLCDGNNIPLSGEGARSLKENSFLNNLIAMIGATRSVEFPVAA
jgi:hypothetical protein